MKHPDPEFFQLMLQSFGHLSIILGVAKARSVRKAALKKLPVKLLKMMEETHRRVQGNRGSIPITWNDVGLILEGSLKDCLEFMEKENEK
jgi:hypothetical protein